jgi:hypothetical protein
MLVKTAKQQKAVYHNHVKIMATVEEQLAEAFNVSVDLDTLVAFVSLILMSAHLILVGAEFVKICLPDLPAIVILVLQANCVILKSMNVILLLVRIMPLVTMILHIITVPVNVVSLGFTVIVT